jgi:hypothetical protein
MHGRFASDAHGRNSADVHARLGSALFESHPEIKT